MMGGLMARKRKPKRGRILYPSVSASRRVARLSLAGALLYDYMIAHSATRGGSKVTPARLGSG